MTRTVVHKAVNYLTVHIDARLKEREPVPEISKKDTDLEIEDVQRQSLALRGKCPRTCAWFAWNNAVQEEIQLLS